MYGVPWSVWSRLFGLDCSTAAGVGGPGSGLCASSLGFTPSDTAGADSIDAEPKVWVVVGGGGVGREVKTLTAVLY